MILSVILPRKQEKPELTHRWKKNESENPNEKADKVEKCEEAAAVIREYDEIIRAKKEYHMDWLQTR